MRSKIVAAVLCVLAALGLVNIGKSIANRFFSDTHETRVHVVSKVDEEVHHSTFSSSFRTSDDELVVDKRFDVTEGGTLDLSIGHADVTIGTSNDAVASVRVTLTGRDMDLAREYFESLNFQVRKDGDRIVVKTEPSRRNWNWRSNGGVEIDVDVVIPRRFNARIAVAHGDLELGDLVGNLTLRNAHGDATIGSIDGEKVDVQIAHGDVEIGAVKARSVRFNSAHGDLTTGQLSADDIEMKSAHGDIEMDVQGGRNVDIVNSHGHIGLKLASPLSGSISNSHGDIDIDAPADLAANVDFHGTRIEIGGGQSFKGTQTRSRMEGTLNGGGPTLRAQTSFGSIAIN